MSFDILCNLSHLSHHNDQVTKVIMALMLKIYIYISKDLNGLSVLRMSDVFVFCRFPVSGLFS